MTSGGSEVPAALLETVRGMDVDEGYLRHVVESITAIGSCAQGFRTSGTPEDVAVAAFVRDEMAAIGLDAVAIEPVAVDAWRFLGAGVAAGGLTVEASSLGGVPGTGPGGVTGRLVDVEDAFQQWRFRHLQVVQRTIGHKVGTGGSSGVDFLRRALDLTFFPELYEVRTRIGQ